MDPTLSIQHEFLLFKEIVNKIASAECTEDGGYETASQLYLLMRKHSASYDIINQMAGIIIKEAESLFPFLIINSNDELLKVLSESRAGRKLYDTGLKGLLKRKFSFFNEVELAYILFLELYNKYSSLIINDMDKNREIAIELNNDIQTLVSGLRKTFDMVADTELTIDTALQMVKSICNDLSFTENDVNDIISGKGRLTLCTTKDSAEARLNAKNENIEYIIKDGSLTFSMRIGIDVNMEVEASPKMAATLRKHNIDFVLNEKTSHYIIDYTHFKSPEDFTFGQMIDLSPTRNYFPKAINIKTNKEIPINTFARIKTYNSSGQLQTYKLPEAIKWDIVNN